MKSSVTIDSNGTYMPYDKAIDLAFKLSKEEAEGWTYTTEINATTNLARVAVYDDDNNKMGYL